MGQRLNIEIWDKGQVLANAYYHWSAYTLLALKLIEKIITNVDNLVECDNDRLKAVWLLQLTGAGLTQDELSTIYCKGFTGITEESTIILGIDFQNKVKNVLIFIYYAN